MSEYWWVRRGDKSRGATGDQGWIIYEIVQAEGSSSVSILSPGVDGGEGEDLGGVLLPVPLGSLNDLGREGRRGGEELVRELRLGVFPVRIEGGEALTNRERLLI